MEFIQITLVLEKNYLAIRLATGLQSDAQLRHRRVTDESVMHIHMTFASCTADYKAARAYRREYRIRVAVIEERRTISRMLEKIDGLIVVAGVCHGCSKGYGKGRTQESSNHHCHVKYLGWWDDL